MNRKEEIKAEAAASAKDPRTRRIAVVAGAIAVCLLLATGGVVALGWSDSQDEAEAGHSLAVKVLEACNDDVPETEQDQEICDRAFGVVEQIQGLQGDQGEQGVPGLQGIQGIQGIQGETGAKGARGERGPPGADGKRGATGATGATGRPGEDGSDGAPGPQGDPGPQGPPGPVGPKGDPGASAFPFTFRFTVPSDIPGQPDDTYTATCTPDGCTVTREET